jgi:AcrR family transcriptional regulator
VSAAFNKARTTRRARSPREAAKEVFRTAILRAAEEVFSERGFHETRIQDIAERAAIGVGTVYNHFDQKEDVLDALLTERGEAMVAELAPHDDDPVDWEARLRARFGRLFAYVDRHRTAFLLAIDMGLFGGRAASCQTLSAGAKARILKETIALMEEGIAAGAIGARDLRSDDSKRLARFFLGGMRALLEGGARDGAADLRAEGDLAITLFLRAAAPPAGAPKHRPHGAR